MTNETLKQIDEAVLAQMKEIADAEGSSVEDGIYEMERMENEPPPSKETLRQVVELMDKMLIHESSKDAQKRCEDFLKLYDGVRGKALRKMEEAE